MKWLAIVMAILSGATLMCLTGIQAMRLRLILVRKGLPSIPARVEYLDLSRNAVDGVPICELHVRCSYEGRRIPLYFRIIAPDLESARKSERYFALDRILRVGETVRLHYQPGMRFLGYFLDQDVYPQAAPEAVAQAASAFRSHLIIGALLLLAGVSMLLLLL